MGEVVFHLLGYILCAEHNITLPKTHATKWNETDRSRSERNETKKPTERKITFALDLVQFFGQPTLSERRRRRRQRSRRRSLALRKAKHVLALIARVRARANNSCESETHVGLARERDPESESRRARERADWGSSIKLQQSENL